MAYIVAVANQKGGVGKTTTCYNICGALAQRGFRTLLVDADPQQSAVAWRQIRPDADLRFSLVAMASGTIHKDLPQLLAESAYDWVLVDCPPSVQTQLITRSALLAADAALIPVSVSFHDLHATQDMRGLIELARQFNDRLRPFLLINNKPPNTRLGREARAAAAEIGLPVLSSEITARVAVKECSMAGVTILDYDPASASAAEYVTLTEELIACLTPKSVPA